MSGGAGVGAVLPDPPSVESTLSATLVTAKRPRRTGELTGLLAVEASETVGKAAVTIEGEWCIGVSGQRHNISQT